jgi:hypothetical protein
LLKKLAVSDKRVKRNEEYAKGVDKLHEELKQKVLQGKSDVNKSDIQVISKAEPTFIANTDKEIIEKAKEIRRTKSRSL